MKYTTDKSRIEGPTTKQGLFSQTDWNVMHRIKDSCETQRRCLLDNLARKYWAPISHYLLLQGYEYSEAQDLTQDFFVFALETHLFSKADPLRGRFRSFLMRSLNHFLANQRRASIAQKRKPSGGVASVEDLVEFGHCHPKALVEAENPETLFHRAWLGEVLKNVLSRLDHDFRKSGKTSHLVLFRARVVAPHLEGVRPPSLHDQARELGLQYKEAANQIITAKRAFLRILEEEIEGYASPGEIADERKDMLDLVKVDV